MQTACMGKCYRTSRQRGKFRTRAFFIFEKPGSSFHANIHYFEETIINETFHNQFDPENLSAHPIGQLVLSGDTIIIKLLTTTFYAWTIAFIFCHLINELTKIWFKVL